MTFETERLIQRPWKETDAESLYEYAKDDRVGPVAGWPVHTSAENSRAIIREVLSVPENYAVCLKADNRAIGCVGLMIGKDSNIGLPDTQGEIGYWIGVPFWGRGLIPEAVRAVIRHAFCDLGLETLWCGYFDGNEQSKRVMEKCGFVYHHTNENIYWPRTGDVRTEHIATLPKAAWQETAQSAAPMRILVSACLLGRRCKYNGGDNYSEAVEAFVRGHEVVPVCPELAGGLSVPRSPCEIVNGVVMNRDGENVDEAFRNGAAACVGLAKEKRIDLAVLQSRSPSCGVRQIYDGSFSGRKIEGSGVFAAMLRENGFRVLDAEDLKGEGTHAEY